MYTDELKKYVQQVLKPEIKHYNNDPVFYCAECLSLRIRSIGNIDYCDKCGSTEIKETHISQWEELYREKYGIDYLIDKKNGRE